MQRVRSTPGDITGARIQKFAPVHGGQQLEPRDVRTGIPQEQLCCRNQELALASAFSGVNEFYKKGCQEKSSASTGGLRVFLEIQPTVFRYL